MQLPSALAAAVERELERHPVAALRAAAAALSNDYRGLTFASSLGGKEKYAAYLAVRMPATYAAVRHVVGQLAWSRLDINSLLDLGAGPGTASFAALDAFPHLRKITMMERDAAWEEVSRALSTACFPTAPELSERKIEHLRADIATAAFSEADAVVACYALGEMAGSARTESVSRAWQAAQKLLVIIEPGTRAGFGNIVSIRDQLLQLGAQILAPCPHHEVCPMLKADDWCHFSARVERTALHRTLKGGDLGHEDEKFSYIAVTKKLPPERPEGRIVRHPIKASGHVKLTLCTVDDAGESELRGVTITRSRKPLYRPARAAEWGDGWPPQL